MGDALQGFWVIGSVVAVGYVMARSGAVAAASTTTIAQLSFFVALPALLFTTVAAADVRHLVSVQLIVAAGSAVTVAVVFVLASRLWFRRSRADTIVGAASSCYVNATNIGLPIAVYLLGDASLVVPTLLLQVTVLAPLVTTLLHDGGDSGRGWSSTVWRMWRNPLLLASLGGMTVALLGGRIPAVIAEPLRLLGGAAVPLMLLSFGISLYGQRPLERRADRMPIIAAIALKCVLMPLCAWVIAAVVFGMPSDLVRASMVVAALPTAQNILVFAQRAGRGVAVARDAGLLSTLFSVPVIGVLMVLPL